MKTINVVCGIIIKDDKILLCRKKKEKSMWGFWEFPWGKVEQDESETEALKRELYEELKMNVEVRDYFTTNEHTYENFRIKLIAYICDFIDAEFVMSDHDKYEWASVDELLTYKLAPADIPIAESISNSIFE